MRYANDDDHTILNAIDHPVVADAQSVMSRNDADQNLDSSRRSWIGRLAQDRACPQELESNGWIKSPEVPLGGWGKLNAEGVQARAPSAPGAS